MKLDRRQFLRATGALALYGQAAHPHAQPPDPVGQALQRLGQKTGLKIDRIETFTLGATVSFVRVHGDDGSTGMGQLAPFDADISASVLHR
ncbi:MAG: hypothetical protein AB7K24_21425, partial [Gemmataceae bacterium]